MVLGIVPAMTLASGAMDADFVWRINNTDPENPRDPRVTTMGEGNHVMKLDDIGLTEEDIPKIIENRGGDLDITYREGQTAGSSRRFWAWTDLSGEADEITDITFNSSASRNANLVVRTDPRLDAPHTSARLTIPVALLYDAATETLANEIYILLTIDGGGGGGALNDQRGGGGSSHQEFNRLDYIGLSITPCNCGGALGGGEPCIDCDIHIFPFPLEKPPSMIWEGGAMRGWESRSDFEDIRFNGDPLSRARAGVRYMVLEFNEEPDDWAIRFQDTSWLVYELDYEDISKNREVLPNGVIRYVIDFDEDLPPRSSPFHRGYKAAALYGNFQVVFFVNPDILQGQTWDSFMARLGGAYLTNRDPNEFPLHPETLVGKWSSIAAHDDEVIEFDSTELDELKLYYNYEATGDVSSVRLQYSVDDGESWRNIHRSFSIINISETVKTGRRIEILPRETYDAENLQIRWIPHGLWGEAEWGGTFTLTNVEIYTGLQNSNVPRATSPVSGISSMTNITETIVQRQTGSVDAPWIDLYSGFNDNVIWTSSDPNIARPINTDIGADIRGFGEGEVNVTVAAAADVSVFTEFYVKVTGVDKKDNITFEINNPYAGVDWYNYGRFKATLHNHTTQSDGQHSTQSSAARFYEQGFHFAAITDHSHTSITVDRPAINSSGNPRIRVSDDSTHAGNPRIPLDSGIQAQMAAGENVTVQVEDDNWKVGVLRPSWFVGETNELQDGKLVSRTIGRTGAGLKFVPGTNEHSSQMFYGIAQAPSGHHINTFWSNILQIGNSPTSSNHNPHTMQQMVARMEAEGRGGLARVNHPGRYTGSEWETAWADAERIAHNSANYVPYAEFYMSSHNVIGTEIVNKFDTETQAERVLWDNILSITMPEGVPVWGTSDDDAHSNNAIGFSFNIMLMPEFNMAELRHAMDAGSFFAFSRVDRQYQIYPGNYSVSGREWGHGDGYPGRIEPWDWDAGNRDDEPAKATRVQPVLRRPMPVINSIMVDDEDYTITINAENNKFIRWYADGVMIQEDVAAENANSVSGTLDLTEKQLSVYSYVRATVGHPSYGVLYTQPFEIIGGYDETERVFPNLTDVAELKIDLARLRVSEFDGHTIETMAHLEAALPAGIAITTDQCHICITGCVADCDEDDCYAWCNPYACPSDCDKYKPRFATIKWDLSNADLDNLKMEDVSGVVVLPTGVKKVTNTDNIPLGITSLVEPKVEGEDIDFDFEWSVNEPRDETVSQTGVENHVLKLDLEELLEEDDFYSLRGNDGAALTVNYGTGGNNSTRRISVWTDLSKNAGGPLTSQGAEVKIDDITFVTTDNLKAGEVLITPSIASGTMSVRINIPKTLLYDGENVATTIYAIITTDIGADGENAAEGADRATRATNNRGGARGTPSAEFQRFDNIKLAGTAVVCCREAVCICHVICEHDWSGAWVPVPGSEATCTTNGLEALACEGEDGCEAKIVRTLAAIGHQPGSWAAGAPANCTQGSTEISTCGNGCGEAGGLTRFSSFALGHDYTGSAWRVEKQSTPRFEGLHARDCVRTGCTHVDERVLNRVSSANYNLTDVNEFLNDIDNPNKVFDFNSMQAEFMGNTITNVTLGGDVLARIKADGDDITVIISRDLSYVIVAESIATPPIPFRLNVNMRVDEDSGDITITPTQATASAPTGVFGLDIEITFNAADHELLDFDEDELLLFYISGDRGTDVSDRITFKTIEVDDKDVVVSATISLSECAANSRYLLTNSPQGCDCDKASCDICNEDGTYFALGDVDGNGLVNIFDALEVLKSIVGMNSTINHGDKQVGARHAALIVPPSGGVPRVNPNIFDALEILKFIVGMNTPVDAIHINGRPTA
jgi:hypothetical protein